MKSRPDPTDAGAVDQKALPRPDNHAPDARAQGLAAKASNGDLSAVAERRGALPRVADVAAVSSPAVTADRDSSACIQRRLLRRGVAITIDESEAAVVGH